MVPGTSGWRDYHKRVRPLPPDVGANIARQIAGHDSRVLLLGVTRDLAHLGERLTAVDFCEEQIDHVWIGNSPTRRAVLADWRQMDLPRGHFTAAIGDGSLSTLAWPEDYRRALSHIAAALAPRGVLVVRCFLAPDRPETVEQIAADVRSGRVASFYAARWRIGMALAGSGNVAVSAIYAAFDRAFPDRAALAARTGWPLDEIEVIEAYRGSDLIYSFLTRQDLLETLTESFTNARFVSSGDYERAERYPLLVAKRRA